MTKVLCGSMAALALMLAPAVAADLSVAPIYKVPPTPPTNWTGSYIGLSGGGVWGNAKVYNGTTGVRRDALVQSQGRACRCYGWVRSSRAATGCWASRATSRSPTRRAAHSRCPGGWLQQRGQRTLALDLSRPHRRGAGQLAVLRHGRWRTGEPAAQASRRRLACRFPRRNGTGAGPSVLASRSSSTRIGRRRSNICTSACRTSRTSTRRRTPAFQNDQRVRADDHAVRVGVNYKLPWTLLDGFFKR